MSKISRLAFKDKVRKQPGVRFYKVSFLGFELFVLFVIVEDKYQPLALVSTDDLVTKELLDFSESRLELKNVSFMPGIHNYETIQVISLKLAGIQVNSVCHYREVNNKSVITPIYFLINNNLLEAIDWSNLHQIFSE